jgi:ribosomal protein L34E
MTAKKKRLKGRFHPVNLLKKFVKSAKGTSRAAETNLELHESQRPRRARLARFKKGAKGTSRAAERITNCEKAIKPPSPSSQPIKLR